MKDLYIENERLKEVIARGRKRIQVLTERIEEYEKIRMREKRYTVDISEDSFAKKTNELKKHCIYQKHFCDGTPNLSQTRYEDKIPMCPKYDICAIRKNRIVPELDKNK